MPIYVEIFIRGSMDELWRLTQTPELHQQWDLRFTSITYLNKPEKSQPQRFRYATRIGAGMEIQGWGQTVGDQADQGMRSSALQFGSDDWRSLINKGSGYWKYEQTPQGVRFITGYDYQVRWGLAGRILDRLLFRPMIGWATAWSFDRLRLWIESGVEPAQAARQALTHALATAAVSFAWLWHGVVPKLLGPHATELAMMADAGFSEPLTWRLTMLAGVLEVAFGLCFFMFAKQRWPWVLTILLMTMALIGVVSTSPALVMQAFNPVSLNVLLASIAGVGLLNLNKLVSARSCLRRAPRDVKEANKTGDLHEPPTSPNNQDR